MNTTSWERASTASVVENLCYSWLDLCGGVNTHVDKGDPVGIMHVDFQKVFYKVPRQSCLKMLSCLEGKLLLWI